MNPTVSELEIQLKAVSDTKTKIDLLTRLSRLISLEDLDRSRQLAEEAYELSSNGEFEHAPYGLGQAASLSLLASYHNVVGTFDVALSQAFQTLEILETLPGDLQEVRSIKVDALGDISWTYRSFGDLGVAADYAMQALKLAQSLEDRQREVGILNILSVIYGEAKDLKSALETGQKVLENSRELGYVNGESLALNNLALTYLDLGDREKALETALEGLGVAHENKITDLESGMLGTVGEIYLANNDLIRAEEYLTRGLILAREGNNQADQVQCLKNLGKIYQRQQQYEAACNAFQSALSISAMINERLEESLCHKALSEVYENNGNLEKALYHFKQFHDVEKQIFNETSAKRLAGLQVIHQVETAKRDAQIHYLQTIELKREIDERKGAQAILEKLASIDPLTEVLNRREFFIRGEREVERTIQSGGTLTAILLDIDHFKRINDQYGHAVGDTFLVQTARFLRDSLRQNEIIGRYGGDEFTILLPDCSWKQGQQIAERLRTKIASQIINTPYGEVFITLSLGIAELRQTGDSKLETLLACADQALYAAKRAGRNQLFVYGIDQRSKN